MPDFLLGFGIVANVLCITPLASGFVERSPLSFPIIFLGLGFLLGERGLDLYVADLGRSSSAGESAKLFQNSCDWGNNWLAVKLHGTQSNRDGIGARVIAAAGVQMQIREVMAGSSSGSQSMLPAHFGLGQHSQVDTLTIFAGPAESYRR